MGMLDTARAHFWNWWADAFALGVPLGVGLGTWGGPSHSRAGTVQFPTCGRRRWVGGYLRGLAFGKWMAQVNFFPLIAGLIDSIRRWWVSRCISSLR